MLVCRVISQKLRSITLARAEFCFAERFLAKKWKWTHSRVTRFLKKLERRGILRGSNRSANGAQTKPHVRVYSIRSYNKYQVVGLPKQSANAAQSETQPEAKKKHKELRDTNVSPGSRCPERADISVQKAFDAYNAIAHELDLPLAKRLTLDRRRKLSLKTQGAWH